MILKDKVAIVTGGANGIGAAICCEFAKEGASVAIFDMNLEAAEKLADKLIAEGGKATAKRVDVSDGKSVEDATLEVCDRFGALDIWVNNAGVSRILPFLDHTEELWDLTMNVNLKGTFWGCQSAVRQMLKNNGGSIINMSSQSGQTGNSHFQAYCASKFGVIGLTQSLAMEFAKEGIRVNAICPGVVWTSMWDAQAEDYAKKRNMPVDQVKPYFESKIPMGRVATEKEVARTAVFLASDESSYLTGQSISLSGGTIM